MELESGSSRVGCCRPSDRRRVSDGGACSTRRAWGSARDATGSHGGSRQTTPETWAVTLAKTPVGTTSLGGHDVSKPSVTEASWSAERIGPITIGAPQRGQCQAGAVEDVSAGTESRRSNRRASARRAVRHALAR